MCRIIHKPILRINKLTLEIKEYINRYSASQEGFNSSKIGLCLKTKYNTYKGYFWFYKEEFTDTVLSEALKRNNEPKRKKDLIPSHKICTKCNLSKSIQEFYKTKNRIRSNCKPCEIQRSIIYKINNKEKVNKRVRSYKYTSKRYHRDLQFKLTRIIRNRVRAALKTNKKPDHILKNIGCSLQELKIFIEDQFKPGMTWENHGKWHIDHIVPLCSFDLNNKDEFLKAINYKNLQPLWAKENLSKGGKIE